MHGTCLENVLSFPFKPNAWLRNRAGASRPLSGQKQRQKLVPGTGGMQLLNG